MKRILLLSTGGTIGCIQTEEGLIPGIPIQDLVGYLPLKEEDVQIDTDTVLNIDSTNMQPEHWEEIAKAVYAHYPDYDGFVITHGTDTLSYTSAALSYMLPNLQKPVVLTGSIQPIDAQKTDGVRNLTDAVTYAKQGEPGVFVVFGGRVIEGTHAVKMRTESYDAFESINYPYIAYIEGDRIEPNMDVPDRVEGDFRLETGLCTDVHLFKLYPGVKPEMLNLIKDHFQAVIIETFGSGGLPFLERDLTKTVEELIGEGKIVVITTQCLEEGADLSLYKVGRVIDQEKVILSNEMNTEALLPKLMWAMGRTSNFSELKQLVEGSSCP
ncbi:UNVERIFIED_CONTAM: asparaginase [Halobacillus marinus]|uniref:asparaginase n=1 Tax=Halobacillus sp. BAB-2008 TaxID=1246484 RepID=UPI0002A4DC06|nr:asparaginase [Halobacillus sp. BAB-2008]ELK47750.1 L-asparaginase [Halobacillus sp. BAB-2008]